MVKIPYQPQIIEFLPQLIDKGLYTGEFNEKEFIIKRNFGNRRLTLHGKKIENQIHLKAKNELLHQIFLYIAYLLFIILIIICLLNHNWLLSSLLFIVLILIVLSSHHQKQKEYQYFQEALEKN